MPALWNTAWSAFYSSDVVKFILVISDISYFSCFVIIIAKAVLPLFHLYVIDENLDIGIPQCLWASRYHCVCLTKVLSDISVLWCMCVSSCEV